jgi:hypothetical protein
MIIIIIYLFCRVGGVTCRARRRRAAGIIPLKRVQAMIARLCIKKRIASAVPNTSDFNMRPNLATQALCYSLNKNFYLL